MELDIKEVLRMLGAAENPPPELVQAVEEMWGRLTRFLQPRYVFQVFPLSWGPEGAALGSSGLVLPGETAGRMLGECRQAALLACTLGAGFDALLRAQQARDMSRAVLLDACGSVWVERGCDAAEKELAGRFPGQFLTDRFSPGYGDLPLELQEPLCRQLGAAGRLGLHVTDRCLLNPCKSVTAVIGIADRPQPARIRGCACCAMGDRCQMRDQGGHGCGI